MARHADLVRYYGHDRFPRCRAVVALVDGEPLGVAGVARVNGELVAFEDHKPELPPMLMARGAAVARRMIWGIREQVAAIPDPAFDGAPDLLRRLGFEPDGHRMVLPAMGGG